VPRHLPGLGEPEGVPIDIIIFGGRRSSVVPLVSEAYSWTTACSWARLRRRRPRGEHRRVGNLRRDPFAMKPFCGYHMGDYFTHWFAMGDTLGAKAPRIFYVNWFRKSPEGRFLWPGFSDNSRAPQVDVRPSGREGRREGDPIGLMPKDGDLDLTGLDLPKENLRALLQVDLAEWKAEVPDIEQHFKTFGSRLPARLRNSWMSSRSGWGSFGVRSIDHMNQEAQSG